MSPRFYPIGITVEVPLNSSYTQLNDILNQTIGYKGSNIVVAYIFRGQFLKKDAPHDIPAYKGPPTITKFFIDSLSESKEEFKEYFVTYSKVQNKK